MPSTYLAYLNVCQPFFVFVPLQPIAIAQNENDIAAGNTCSIRNLVTIVFWHVFKHQWTLAICYHSANLVSLKVKLQEIFIVNKQKKTIFDIDSCILCLIFGSLHSYTITDTWRGNCGFIRIIYCYDMQNKRT